MDIQIAVIFVLLLGVAVIGFIAVKKIGRLAGEVAEKTRQCGHLEQQVSAQDQTIAELEKNRAALREDNHSLEKARAVWHEAESNLRQNNLQTQQQLERKSEQTDTLRAQLMQLSRTNAELKTAQQERDQSHARELAQFNEQKKLLEKEFENLANRIFEQKGKSFSSANQQAINQLLQPFREQITGFRNRIDTLHSESIKNKTEMEGEIKKILEVGLKMSDEAQNLTSALKGDTQKIGAWGEAQLERTLQLSGLIEDAHYARQTRFKDRDGRDKYTDYIIKLPDNKHIIIDSKVSLAAYARAVAADSVEQQQAALDEHAAFIKKQIDDLASKDYTGLIGMHSPSFVLMFIPIEPAYIDALKHRESLFGYGYEKGIVLVSHTTLVPILKTIANLWMMERSNAEAREISDRAGEIYNSVCTVAERLQKLGRTLTAASNHYNKTVTALTGQQGLHGKVERFTQLSSKISKSMPALASEPLNFSTDRLQLTAVPVDAPSPAETPGLPDNSAPE